MSIKHPVQIVSAKFVVQITFWNEFYQDPSHHFATETLAYITQYDIQDLFLKFQNNAQRNLFYYLVIIPFVVLWGRQTDILLSHFPDEEVETWTKMIKWDSTWKSVCDSTWYVCRCMCMYTYRDTQIYTYLQLGEEHIFFLFKRIYLLIIKKQISGRSKTKAT